MVDLSNFTAGLGSFSGMAYQANSVTDGVLFTGGVGVFFFIILLAMLRNERPFEEGLAVASWSMFLVSGLLWLGHLVFDLVPILFLVLGVFDVIYLYASR